MKNKLHHDCEMFSTHYSVSLYAKKQYSLSCQCLSEFVSIDEIRKDIEDSIEAVDGLLMDLDKYISPQINKILRVNMRYFVPVYAYHLKFQFHIYRVLLRSMGRIVDLLNPLEIFFYERGLTSLITGKTTKFLTYFFPNIKKQAIHTSLPKNNITADKLGSLYSLFYRIYFKTKFGIIHPVQMMFDWLRTITRENKFSKTKQTVLIGWPLYEFEFLLTQLKKYNILYFSADKLYAPKEFKYKSVVKSKGLFDFSKVDEIYEKNPLMKLLLQDIKEDFYNNIDSHLNSLEMLKELDNVYSIVCGIWGLPPAFGLKSLIFEYLSHRKIEIIGRQHGSLQGVQYRPWQFDSEFLRCNYYLSYGFDRNDLKRVYPNKAFQVEVLPYGKPKSENKFISKREIDILFPMTNSLSIIDGGAARLPCDQLAQRQLELLEYLSSLKGFSVYVKLMVNSKNYQSCAVLPILEKKYNIKVVDNVSLTDFLSSYSPKIVIIEFVSTPLYDVLHLDSEIFLMDDPVHPYENNALHELQKRVHFADKTSEMIHMLDSFLKGDLKPKRDNTYKNHYLSKKNTSKKVDHFIHHLLTDK
ncbi:hypothetical protein [uncultured Desulfobacter sp.]|uniref:hypothetical protein n=1 Tax=uncultured Desulfobacter sp. TaxID=240139 RepID=UPI002AAC22D2|nr:hypothetical protein [uncultured Desulfobacter sp.]